MVVVDHDYQVGVTPIIGSLETIEAGCGGLGHEPLLQLSGPALSETHVNGVTGGFILRLDECPNSQELSPQSQKT